MQSKRQRTEETTASSKGDADKELNFNELKDAYAKLEKKHKHLQSSIESVSSENAKLTLANYSLCERVNLQEEMKAMALQKSHSAILMVNPTRGKIVFLNDTAETLFGPSIGMNVFALFLNNLRPFVEASLTKDSVVQVAPVSFGMGLWKKIREHETSLFERVQLKTELNPNPIDASLVMKFIYDGNNHPWIIIEVLDIERLNKDAMTGLYRREVAVAALKRELTDRNSPLSSPLSVIMMDIDNFKNFNTLYQYEGGDKVLKNIAKVIKDEIRPKDVACRWFSGDEFLVVVYGGCEAARAVAERILERVKALRVNVINGETGKDEHVKVGLSIGYAERTEDDDWLSLTRRAEAQLLHSKQNGKGCVSSATITQCIG